MSKTRILATTGLLFTIYLFFTGSSSEPRSGFRINPSDSLPYSLFWRTKADPEGIRKDVVVSFYHPQFEVKLAKCVAGLCGDEIKLTEDMIYINDFCIGQCQHISSSGDVLTPIQEQRIPTGFVFVYGQHPMSFDSRYNEFGLVKIDDIEDVLWPIF